MLKMGISIPGKDVFYIETRTRKFRHLQLQNCNLSQIHPRAFAEWPQAEVRKYTSSIFSNLSSLSVTKSPYFDVFSVLNIWNTTCGSQILQNVLSLKSQPVDKGHFTETTGNWHFRKNIQDCCKIDTILLRISISTKLKKSFSLMQPIRLNI